MRKSVKSMVAQPDYRFFSQGIESYRFFINKGELNLDDKCKKTWRLIQEYKLSREELNYLLGIYHHYRDKEQGDIGAIASVKFRKNNMPTRELRVISQALTSLRRRKWLDDGSVSTLKDQIKLLLRSSENGSDFVNQQLIKLFLNKYRKHKDPELSLLITMLADLMWIKTCKVNYRYIGEFLEEQEIPIDSRNINRGVEDAVKKRYQRCKKHVDDLKYIRKCKTLLPISDSVPTQRTAVKPSSKSEEELVYKYAVEIAKQIKSVPPAYRDIMAVFCDNYVTALEEFNKAIAVKA